MRTHIDLNADLGEGCTDDAGLMSVITSCNIACGGHAGDAASMRAALSLAKVHGVAAGAHPSFPDRENFGRATSTLSGPELEVALSEQVQALQQIAEEVGVELTHVKPHGALYNMAVRDAGLATSLARVTDSLLAGAALVGPADSELQLAAQSAGLTFIAEGFADRAYEPDGQLRDRAKTGATITDTQAQVKQALELAMHGQVATYSGDRRNQTIDTLCVHGDTLGALGAAKAIRAALEQNGIRVCAPS